MKFATYIFFAGDAEEAFRFYHSVLGGEITAMAPHEGTPGEDHVPPEWKQKIMHACLEVDGNMLMASDAPPDRDDGQRGGFSVSIQLDDVAEGERIFTALSEGGTISMPYSETFWSKGFGMFKDRFGVNWMVNCPAPQ